MTKILLEIEDSKLNSLDLIVAKNNWTRSQAIRYAIEYLLEKEKKDSDISEKAFGLWSNKSIDGLEYQKKLRDEWN